MVNPTDYLSEEAYEAALEEAHAPLATPTEACREFARNMGAEYPDRAWLLTSYDTWEANPYYQGPPQRHPEDDPEEEDSGVRARPELVEAVKAHARAHYEQNGWDMVVECYTDDELAAAIGDAPDEFQAVARVASIACAYDERRREVQAEIF